MVLQVLIEKWLYIYIYIHVYFYVYGPSGGFLCLGFRVGFSVPRAGQNASSSTSALEATYVNLHDLDLKDRLNVKLIKFSRSCDQGFQGSELTVCKP